MGDTQLLATTHSPLLPDQIGDEYLFVCRKVGGRTRTEPFSDSWSPLSKGADVDKALEPGDEDLSPSVRILRGDFDA